MFIQNFRSNILHNSEGGTSSGSVTRGVAGLYSDLEGKTALITGASSGLGEQFARALSGAGCRIILAARRLEKLEKFAEELGNSLALQLDVSNKQLVQTAFTTLEERGERVDICVNNAGIANLSPIFDEDEDNIFENIMQTNVMGVWYVTKEVCKHMKKHSIHGSIINISSINGDDYPRTELAAYNASKSAVIQLTRTIATKLAECKIRANCILPGLFCTPLTSRGLTEEKDRKAREDIIPLNFVATPPDLDAMILYLASNQASKYVTGANFTVDGGVSCVRKWIEV